MKDQTLSGGVPYGAIALFTIAFLLYSGFLANLMGSRGTDVAGRGMAMGFAAIIGLVLWSVLAVLFVLAFVNGSLPPWAAAAAVVLVPLSAIAAVTAAGLADDKGRWLMAAPFLLPPLIAFYALWARLPEWRDALPVAPTSAVLGGAIVLLTAVPLALGWIETMPDPRRDAARAEQERIHQEEARRWEQQMQEDDDAKFARLGPDSSLGDYLDYLPPGAPRSKESLAGARLVRSRNADAAALLGAGRIDDLPDLWRLDLDSASVCRPYAAALQAQAITVDRTRSDYISVALDLERQLSNMKWLAGARCDLGKALAAAEARVRAIADDPRLTALADAIAEQRQVR